MIELQKWEVMLLVKNVLVRHGVDLTLLDFSVSKTTIYLHGLLRRDPRGDFSTPQVIAMLKELEQESNYMTVQADLANWEIEGTYGDWQVRPVKLQLGGANPNET